MDFDSVDDVQPFEEAVAAAKQEVLRGLSVEQDWQHIVDHIGLFKEVATEGKARGQLFGSLLVAMRAMTEAVQRRALEGNSAVGCSTGEATVLCALAALYSDLFHASPVPTVVQWRRAVHASFGADTPAREALAAVTGGSGGGPDGAADEGPSRSSSNTGGEKASGSVVYAQHIADELTVANDVQAGRLDFDDGSSVEAELKLFLRRLLLFARKCTRLCDANEEADGLRQMVMLISQHVNNSTLEW